MAGVSESKATDAIRLLSVYHEATATTLGSTLVDEHSDCNTSECAFNFKTDDQDFGFNVQYLEGVDSAILGFQTQALGAKIGAVDWASSLEVPRYTRVLGASSQAAIATVVKDNFFDALQIVGVSKFLSNQSECRYFNDIFWCALNYGTDHENFGIALAGLLNSDHKSIHLIQSLHTDPNGTQLTLTDVKPAND